jgi:2-aminobenzoate-CoA ligase
MIKKLQKEIREKGVWRWPGKELPDAWVPLKKYLPPKDHWPDFLWDFQRVPELRLVPYRLNIGELAVDEKAKRFPDKVALLYEDEKITWGELETLVNKAGNTLKSLGVTLNDRVAICMPNQPTWIVTALACWKIGAIVTLMNHLYKASTIEFIANDSEAKVIVADHETIDEILKARPNLQTVENILVLGVDRKGCLRYEDTIKNESTHLEPAETNRFQFCRLIYTSGTTGMPKGCLRTADQMLATSLCHGVKTLGITRDDVISGHPYFTFAFGSVNFTMNPWLPGCAISIIRQFTPEKQWELVEKHKITQIYSVPAALKLLLRVEDVENKYDIRSLRLVQSAADILPAEIYKEWRRRFPFCDIIDSLGSSELDYWLTTSPYWPEEKIGSIGYSVPGMESMIVRADGSPSKVGEVGELITRGIWGILYWKRPEKMKESIISGWNRMGLYALVDEDGCFWLKGRTVTLIKYSGYSVVGQEVATFLLGHRAIKDCGVVGSPDPLRGQIVKAYVILNEGYEPSEKLTEELRQYCKERMEFYKVPRAVEYVTELPRTATGKVDLMALAKMEEEKARAVK